MPLVTAHLTKVTLVHRLFLLRPKFLCPCRKVECVLLISEVATEVALLTADTLLCVG